MRNNAHYELLQRAKRGNKRAVDLLWYMESANIHQKVMGFSEDEDDAMSLSAECLTHICNRAGSFKGGSKFFTWALTLITNVIKDSGNRYDGLMDDAMGSANTGVEEVSASLLISTSTVYSLQGNITDIYTTVEDEIVSDYQEEYGYGEED